jgi:hypothetical protein
LVAAVLDPHQHLVNRLLANLPPHSEALPLVNRLPQVPLRQLHQHLGNPLSGNLRSGKAPLDNLRPSVSLHLGNPPSGSPRQAQAQVDRPLDRQVVVHYPLVQFLRIKVNLLVAVGLAQRVQLQQIITVGINLLDSNLVLSGNKKIK